MTEEIVTSQCRVVLSLFLLALAVPAWASFSGAIYSTDINYTVNKNFFASKPDVYLDGGPNNSSANGLPPGNYYFQVTDPSGKVLLSTDDISCREVVVTIPAGFTEGTITGAAGPCPHAVNPTANSANGSDSVQVIPFADTPNGGGVYKIWLTPVASYVP